MAHSGICPAIPEYLFDLVYQQLLLSLRLQNFQVPITRTRNILLMAARQATINRSTSETSIEVSLNLDCAPGSGVAQIIDVSTGIGFLDHASLFHSVSLGEASSPLILYSSSMYTDVYRSRKTRGNVAHHEVQRGSLDRRSPYSRYV